MSLQQHNQIVQSWQLACCLNPLKWAWWPTHVAEHDRWPRYDTWTFLGVALVRCEEVA